MKSIALSTAFFVLCYLGVPLAQGAEDCGANQELCVPVGTWEVKVGVGMGLRSNPLAEGDDIPIVLVPQVTYYGERFFFDHLDVGYTLIDRRDLMVNTILTPGTDGIFFFKKGWRNLVLDGGFAQSGVSSPVDTPLPSADAPATPEDYEVPQQPPDPISVKNLHPRRLAGMAGIEIISSLKVVDVELQLLSDVTGVHHGEELRFTVGTSKTYRSSQFAIAVGTDWKSSSLLNYYYGIAEHEVSNTAHHYTPSSGASPFARVSWSKPIGKNWHWLASVQYQPLSQAMRNSPLVEDNSVTQIFVGGVYNF